MAEYLKEHGTRRNPQSEQIRPDQVPNSNSGYVWPVDDLTRLRRFLILGSEGGSYYASERDLTKENVAVIRQLAAENGAELVAVTVAVSQAGRAPKNDPALFALAVAISADDPATRRLAAEALPLVARTGTHLFHFVAYAQTMRGWGKSLRWAVANWYLSKPVPALAYQAVKYRQRDGWSHRDLLRKAHPETAEPDRRALFDWIANPDQPLVPLDRTEETVVAGELVPVVLEAVVDPYPVVRAFEEAQRAETPAETARVVRDRGLPREALRTDHLADPEVWRALLDAGMPTGALLRNLANMTRLGVLEGPYLQRVRAALADGELVRRSRIHPLAVLLALGTYATGRGERGRNTWTPIPSVIDALDEAFYLAFDNVEPTGKRHLVAVDVSGSMDQSHVAGTRLTPREAAAALAMVTLHAEDDVDVVAFSAAPSQWSGPGPWVSAHNAWTKARGRRRWHDGIEDGLTPMGLSRRQRLDDVVAKFRQLPIGGTDCAMPMEYALDQGRSYDAFVILTDSETWAGDVHPAQALRAYRERTGIPARLAVVAMVANRFSIADPRDAGMMDFVGFDAATPTLLSEFVAGRV